MHDICICKCDARQGWKTRHASLSKCKGENSLVLYNHCRLQQRQIRGFGREGNLVLLFYFIYSEYLLLFCFLIGFAHCQFLYSLQDAPFGGLSTLVVPSEQTPRNEVSRILDTAT